MFESMARAIEGPFFLSILLSQHRYVGILHLGQLGGWFIYLFT